MSRELLTRATAAVTLQCEQPRIDRLPRFYVQLCYYFTMMHRNRRS